MEVISSFFFKDRDAEKIYSLLSAAFQNHNANNADFPTTKYFMVGLICFEFAEGV